MAKFIPEYIINNENMGIIKNNSEAEYNFLIQIKNMNPEVTKDWVVIYSDKNYIANEVVKEYEIDFILIIPHYRIFIIEVKGGRIVKINGNYKSINRYNDTNDIDPWKQVDKNYQNILNQLKIDKGYKIPVKNFEKIVAFTDQEYGEEYKNFNPGFSDDNIIYKGTSYENFFMKEKFKANDETDNWDCYIKVLKECLVGMDVIKSYNASDIIFYENKAIINETKKIIDIYKNILYLNDRCLISGVGGSGKTELAKDIYNKTILNQQKPLFIVFNHKLAQELQENLSTDVKEFCLYLANLFNINSNNAKEILNRIKQIEDLNDYMKNFEKYDCLIIDEFQDYENDPIILNIFNNLLKHGLENGKWDFFYDEKQKLRVKSWQESLCESEELIKYRPVRMNLIKTIRFGEKYKEVVEEYLNNEDKYIIDNDINYELLLNNRENCYYKSFTNDKIDDKVKYVYNEIDSIIKELKSKGYKDKNITILNNKSLTSEKHAHDTEKTSVIRYLKREYGQRLKEYSVKTNNVLTYSTLGTFKGLQNDIIIYLHDGKVNSIDFDYVALTRAKYGLYVIENIEPEYDNKFKCVIVDNQDKIKDNYFENSNINRRISLIDNLRNNPFDESRVYSETLTKAKALVESNVEIIKTENKLVEARVIGTTNTYNVKIERSQTNIYYQCECEFFKKKTNNPCKHIIATILKIQK